MLTLFSIPKPFHGHSAVIQTNAIQSWAQLRPACEIILFGDDEGTADMAARLGLRHIPEVERNEHGTPLLNSLFEQAQRFSSNVLLCYVNADIILMSDFRKAVDRIRRWSRLFLGRPYLLIGRRWNVQVEEPWDFEDPTWESQLRGCVAANGSAFTDWAIDYFVYTRGLWGQIPPFAVGRTAWDDWLIYRARSLGAPVVDATRAVTAVHQNHDYSHSPRGQVGIFEGPEARRNWELAGGESHFFSLRDATWVLAKSGLWPALTRARFGRRRRTELALLRERLRGWLSLVQSK